MEYVFVLTLAFAVRQLEWKHETIALQSEFVRLQFISRSRARSTKKRKENIHAPGQISGKCTDFQLFQK